MRPGTGHFTSDKLKNLYGKKAVKIIKKNIQIKKNDFK